MRGGSHDSRTESDGVRVLVVEGKAKQATAVRKSLEAAPANFVVSPARRLWSASQILAGISIDAVLLDLDLPDSDELQALYELREQAPNIPLLVVGAEGELAERALEAGADDCLKPDEMDPNTLGLRILEAVEQNRQSRRDEESSTDVERQDEPCAARVLLVEDDPWVQRLLRRNLERQGHLVEAINTPQDALAWSQQTDESIDLLICDANPPGMEGERLSGHLQREFPDLVTLLVCSSSPDQPKDGGNFTFLTQPYTLDEFERTVDRLITGE